MVPECIGNGQVIGQWLPWCDGAVRLEMPWLA